jgi:hypothetical protein
LSRVLIGFRSSIQDSRFFVFWSERAIAIACRIARIEKKEDDKRSKSIIQKKLKRKIPSPREGREKK